MSFRRSEMDIAASGNPEDATGQIIASLPGVFYLFRATDGAMLRWNATLAERTGFDDESIAACHPLDLVAPQDHSVVAAAIEKARREGWSDCEACLRTADGDAIPYYFFGRSVHIEGVECISGLGADIRAHRDAQAEAERMRERLVDAVEAMPDGFAYYDTEDTLQLCNSRYRELVGTCAGPLEPGCSFREVLRIGLNAGLYQDAARAPEAWLEQRVRRRREQQHDQFEQRLTTGQWLRVEEHPTRDGGRVSILVDITAFKEREARLRESEQRYRALFNNDSDALVISEVESGRLLDVNPRAEAMFGRDRFHLLQMTRIDLHPMATRTRAEAAYTARCQQPSGAPFRQQVLRADGVVVPVEISATVVVDEVRERRLIQAVIRDITQREMLEQMNADRARVLESIARRAPLGEILRQVERMLEHLGAVRAARVLVPRDEWLVAADGFGDVAVPASVLDETRARDGDDERVPLPDEVVTDLLADECDDACGAGGEAALEVLRDGEGNVVGGLAMVLPAAAPESPQPVRSALVEAAGLASIAIEQQQLADRLSWRAGHDDLTELPNRALLMDRLQQAIARARRLECKTSVMLLDLDDFKQVNDTLGHSVGDRFLRVIAARLAECLREEDTVARLGGDEFVLILPTAGREEAARVADKVVAAVAESVELDGHSLRATPSIGISVHPVDSDTPASLLQYADQAMYAAKRGGKGRYCFFADEAGR